MTSLPLLIGGGLFLILLVLFLLVLKTQSSPESAMLDEVDRQTRADRRSRSAEGGESSVYVWLAKPLSLVRGLFSKEPDANLVRRLSLAGYRQAAHADLFLASRIAVPVLFVLLVVLLFSEGAFFFIVVGIVLGFFAPDFWLAQAIKSRRNRIAYSLPDGLDLLSICMDAGLGLDQGILRVGQE